MQLLGRSDSTPKPENRLKTLFWPRVRYAEDVDLLGTQGYWVCVTLAAFTLIAGLGRSNGLGSLLDALYYFLAGVGIRRMSRFAAASVFLIYLLSAVAAMKLSSGPGIASFFFLAVLLSNIRATWLVKSFAGDNAQEPGAPSTQTSRSLLSDRLARIIWPVGRWLYYGLTVLMVVGIGVLLLQTSRSQSPN